MTDTDNPIVEPGALFYSDSVETPAEDSERTPEPVEEAKTPEQDGGEPSEPTEKSDDEPEQSAEPDEGYIELDGEEVTLSDIRKWRSEGLMQADYTRKRQADADEKRKWEADKQNVIQTEVSTRLDKFSDSIAEVEALIAETDALMTDDLRNYDPDEYLRLKDLQDKRVKAVEKAQALRQAEGTIQAMTPEQVAQQQQLLAAMNPHWYDKDGQPTTAHKEDQELLGNYLKENGYTADDVNRITNARDMQTLLHAAHYVDSLERAKKTKPKPRKVTVSTKPTSKQTPQAKTNAEIFYPNS